MPALNVIVYAWHRHLQSCVGTRARLCYAAFDVQLWKAYFVPCTLYIYTLCVHNYKHVYAI